MPKENIDDHVSKGFRAEVKWTPGQAHQPDGWVQLATVNQASTLTLDSELPGDTPQKFDGWHVTLDREGINRLIRSLRRARDAAYGRDE